MTQAINNAEVEIEYSRLLENLMKSINPVVSSLLPEHID
jgi:hypothetical protein